MSSEIFTRGDFLADEQCQRWIIHCVICGRFGRMPEAPVKALHPKFQEIFPVLTMTPDGVCQVCLPSYNLRKENDAVGAVLRDYVKDHGCPCNWPQFEYWVSKEHGPGWHDEYQNVLAEEALKLSCFKGIGLFSGYDAALTCEVCGRRWRYVSEEWRMMAYRNRLIPECSRITNTCDLIGRWYATGGFEPASSRVLSFENWKRYMLTGEAEQSPSEPTNFQS